MHRSRSLAYTLIEILITVALIGALTVGGYVLMRNLDQTSSHIKLDQDVRQVNNAIRVYQANGGKLTPGMTADEVVLALRRQSKDTKKVAGLKGAMVDPRLNLHYQSTGEAMVSGKRAYWDSDSMQFYVTDTGYLPGVKEFRIGAEPPPLPLVIDDTGKVVNPNLDDRQTYGSFAAVDSWVWDYENTGSSPRATPTDTATTDATMSTSDGGSDDNLIVLDPPGFSAAGGNYDLSWFPRYVTLTPPLNAPPTSSEILFFITGGQWERYSGPIYVDDPGKTITAKTISLDLDHYIDSVEVNHNYTAIPITLDPHHTLRASYRYAELGGPLHAGSPYPTLAPVPRLYLANANDFPDVFKRDTVFQTYWTWDGSNPTVPDMGRYTGIASFSNGYPGEALEINMQSFQNADTVSLKYVMVSKNTTIALSSSVETATVTLEKTVLRKPLVTPGDGSLTGGEKIVMSPDLSGGETPVGIRIYYRTDGTDPGDVNGEPAAGATLYTAPFTLDAFSEPTVRVIARMYPPTAYKRWFTTSQPTVLNYYLPYAEANVYAVLGGNKQIYNINPSNGSNSLFDDDAAYNLRALALDSGRARIYYVEENGTASAGWRLGYLDLLNHAHTTLGNIKASWGYNASAQPQNLVYFDKNLYYIHSATDDLVRISLNEDATGITAITKVADLRNNLNWTNVGDLSVDETGLMFFVDSTKGYHRYDLLSMSGYLALGTASEDFLGLAFFQGRLFGTQTRTTSIHRLAPTTGTSLSTVGAAGSRKFIDLASPSSATAISITKSMWGIDDQSDGPHLIEFRNNYRSPLISVAIDYGVIRNNGASLLTDTRYGIRGLAVSSDGMAYFVNNTRLKFSGSNTWRNRPLLKLNIGTLRLGDPLNVTFVGDLQPNLATMAGTIDPDDVVTGLAIAPTGELYGVLREGASYGSNSADYLFKCTQAATAMTGPSIGISSIGRITSAAGTSGETEDLIFTRDGRLFALDAWTNSLWEISPTTASVLSLMSQNPGCYHGVATDTNDYRIIASDIGGNVTQDNFLQVNGGPDNDEIFINYRERWGYATIEAISFFQPPFLLLSNDVDVFAADGSKTIHGLDFATGQTVPVTDAPWPVRALAYDLIKREIFYLRGGSNSFTLGSFHRDTFVHKIYGDLRSYGFEYTPNALPDNLMYFGGYLWYVEPKTDNLIRVDCGSGVSTIPAGTASSVLTTQTPEYANNDGDYELGMKFRTSVNGTITHIRYYRPPSETGSHIGRLWSSSGSQLASVNFTNETSSGWQQAALSSPIAISANTTYTVSVNCNAWYGITQGGLNDSISNGQISSVAGNNGVYHLNKNTFPNSSWENSNYFRDVVFVGSTSSSASSSGNNIVAQKKVANLNGNDMRFDLIGDLAMTPDGWVYFSAIRTDGQRFCRFQINTLSQFEVLSGPIPSPILLPEGDTYRENWFDALAFAPAATNGSRTLYCTYSSTPSPLLTVDPVTGESVFHKNVSPSLGLIDFSDLHPGELSNPSAITLRPLLKLNNLRASYTYADVGGPFLTGYVPPPATVEGPTVVLNNTNELLLSQQNSAHFQVRWSFDGVNPLTSPAASVTGAFTNGFPGQQLSVSYPLWANRSSLPLQVIAKSLQTNVLADSPLLAPSIPAERMELDPPLVTEVAASGGSRQIQIAANIPSGLIPPGTRLFYTTDGTDPGVVRDISGLDNTVSGTAYTTTIPVPTSFPAGVTEFKVTARLYPPTGLPQWFAASDINYITIPVGLGDGHMDVDTSSQLYPYRRGKTDGHVHAYDKHYNTTGIDFFNVLSNKLRSITENVPPNQKFKILIANGNLSPGARISINKNYNPSDNASWVTSATYDDTAISALPIYSVNNMWGTTTLTKFNVNFDFNAADIGLIQGNPGHVKNNTPGIFGEWRNGALTIQIVKVNPDGSDAFTVNTAFSNGGVQGVATTGLLWEATLFYHGPGGPYSPN